VADAINVIGMESTRLKEISSQHSHCTIYIDLGNDSTSTCLIMIFHATTRRAHAVADLVAGLGVRLPIGIHTQDAVHGVFHEADEGRVMIPRPGSGGFVVRVPD
jgi:hypothetical protein